MRVLSCHFRLTVDNLYSTIMCLWSQSQEDVSATTSPWEANRNTSCHRLHPVYLCHQKEPGPSLTSYTPVTVPIQLCTSRHWLKTPTTPDPVCPSWCLTSGRLVFNITFPRRCSPAVSPTTATPHPFLLHYTVFYLQWVLLSDICLCLPCISLTRM